MYDKNLFILLLKMRWIVVVFVCCGKYDNSVIWIFFLEIIYLLVIDIN